MPHFAPCGRCPVYAPRAGVEHCTACGVACCKRHIVFADGWLCDLCNRAGRTPPDPVRHDPAMIETMRATIATRRKRVFVTGGCAFCPAWDRSRAYVICSRCQRKACRTHARAGGTRCTSCPEESA